MAREGKFSQIYFLLLQPESRAIRGLVLMLWDVGASVK